MFSMIGQELDGLTVLDGFAGSGLLTFEAVSRGASVTTVERNRGVVRQLRERAAELGVTLDMRSGDARDTLSTGSWDIVIMDPPYGDDPVDWVSAGASATDSMLVIEHAPGTVMPATVGNLVLDRSRRYGDSILTIYRRGS
jgi:16S rRNA G966 N2-methylase RsmD